MDEIRVELGARSYPIYIGAGLIQNETLLSNVVSSQQVLVVCNEIVSPLYLDQLVRALPGAPKSLILPDGERHKNLATFSRILDRLVDLKFRRDCCIVALGGGVVGDVTGFAASCYQRGVDLVQVPTTLLAQVDSSVGGKTAVNHLTAKNMIGAFYQPRAVIADTGTLQTLPPREFAAGLAEVIKHGLILDAEFFGWLEHNVERLLAFDEQSLSYAIRRCCEIKAAIVAEDERESGRRALLNLGHTFGHALEVLGGYGRWLHGEAVAIGISMAAATSVALGQMTEPERLRTVSLLTRAGLPVRAPGIDPAAMLAAMRLDKKADRDGMRIVLMNGIGRAVTQAAPDDSVLLTAISDRDNA